MRLRFSGFTGTKPPSRLDYLCCTRADLGASVIKSPSPPPLPLLLLLLLLYRHLIAMRLSRALLFVCALLMLVLLVCARRGADVAHRYLRLRPSPSEHLPVPDLKEDPDPEYDPREQDLSERALLKKLGSGFDGDFMSVSAPTPLPATNATASPGSSTYAHAPGGVMPPEIRRLDLTQTPYGLRVKLGKKARRKFLQWLWTHTHCPVVHVWKDLGVRFWPRYVKEGHCFSERSCSLPEGMFCKPAKSVTKTFLRWYCQGFLPQKYCTWIPVHYPIISECKCSC